MRDRWDATENNARFEKGQSEKTVDEGISKMAETDVYTTSPDTPEESSSSQTVMTEKVQQYAGSIYKEFEKMIAKYDEEVSEHVRIFLLLMFTAGCIGRKFYGLGLGVLLDYGPGNNH